MYSIATKFCDHTIFYTNRTLKSVKYANELPNLHINRATHWAEILFQSGEGIGPPSHEVSSSFDIPFARKRVALILNKLCKLGT